MFGGDPNQMLFQLENYYRDGRLELAEVLSTQLTESLSAIKSRNQDQQLMLVKSLFFLSQILQARGKTKNASKSIKQLVKERRSMLKSFPETSNVSELAEDYRCGAKIFSDLGKNGISKKWFKKCLNYSPNHIAALTEMLEIHGVTKTLLKRMETLVEKSGPVIFVNEEFVIQPEGEPKIEANRVAATVGGKMGEKILSDIEAIKSGNMAKNARIAKALDSLKPTMDYHEYSGNQ
jgi:tetratricopeptide (TPR) repeat protein